MSGTALLVALAALVLVVFAWRGKGAARSSAADHDDQADGDGRPSDEPGVIAIEDAIDLHGFQPRDIPEVVESYLEAAAAKGLTEVRLIHGRGKGVQRERVQRLLATHPLVESFGDAPAHRGGWGATIVHLKVKRE